jgi:hypothetical protein
MIFWGTNFVIFQQVYGFFGAKCEHFSSANLPIFLVMGKKKLANFIFFGVSNFFGGKTNIEGNNSFTHDPELNSQNRNMPFQQFHQMQNLGMTMEHHHKKPRSNK